MTVSMDKKEETVEVLTIPEIFEGWYKEILHTGSRVICDPPPKDTDDDYMLLVSEGAVFSLEKKLRKEGYVKNNGTYEKSNLDSYRKDEVNLLLTQDDEYFEKWKRATVLAKTLNLLNKKDRVTLFEAVVDDSWPIPDYKVLSPMTLLANLAAPVPRPV